MAVRKFFKDENDLDSAKHSFMKFKIQNQGMGSGNLRCRDQ